MKNNNKFVTVRDIRQLQKNSTTPFGADESSIRMIERRMINAAMNSNKRSNKVTSDWYLREDAEKIALHFENQGFKVVRVPDVGASIPMLALVVSW